ncbi:thymidylate synthase [Methanococcus voltae]|uniref:thymidylate synthase n=1 Tax=Methanococcus voltae TaxID=2188 RepID=UPI001FD8B0AF|nr:thymidylate synthase [Methanococcus voltae]
MLILKKKSVKNAFEELIPKILSEGIDMTTEDGQKCKEIMNTIIEITDPENMEVSSKYPLGENAIKSYTNQLINGCSTEFVYDYHERIFEYPNQDKTEKFDQIDYIVSKLSENHSSRRAIAITWNPYIDTHVKDVPCLQFIEFLIRNDELYMTVLFRSNDAYLAFHANALGLIALGQTVADKLNIPLKKYTHHSVSMHVYVKRDIDNLRKDFKI